MTGKVSKTLLGSALAFVMVVCIAAMQTEAVWGETIRQEKQIAEIQIEVQMQEAEYAFEQEYREETFICSYTAEDALHILQAVAGLRMGHLNREYDVNADGIITTEDALLALQSAVRLITVEWPLDYVFME